MRGGLKMFRELSKPFRYKKVLNQSEIKKQTKQKESVHNWRETLKKLWKYLIVNKFLLSFVIVMVIVSSGLGLLGPYLLGMAIDEYIVSSKLEGLLTVLFVLLFIYVLHSLSLWLQNFWMIGIAQRTVWTMRVDLFQHFHKLPISFFDNKKHGELMSRITNDIENVSSTLNSSFIQIISSLLTLVGTIIVMLMLSPLLTFITLLIVPSMFYGMRWITNRTGKLFKEQQMNIGDMNGYIEETISGQKMVKVYSQEKRVLIDFNEKNETLKNAGFGHKPTQG